MDDDRLPTPDEFLFLLALRDAPDAVAKAMLPAIVGLSERALADFLNGKFRRILDQHNGCVRLSQQGHDWMHFIEGWAYAGLGVHLGMPREGLATPVGENSAGVTFRLLDGDLLDLIRVLRETLPPKEAKGYDRHRSLLEILRFHLEEAGEVIGRDEGDDHGYDLGHTVEIARLFGLLPSMTRGGSS